MNSSNYESAELLAKVRVFLTDSAVRSSGERKEIDIGLVRFGSWQVHTLSSAQYASDAYLIRAAFDFELAPGVPGPDWVEIGYEFTGDSTWVLDAVPRWVAKEHESRTYVLTSNLQFAERDGKVLPEDSSFEVPLEGLVPTIKVFGIGRRALRWRHIATTDVGVPAGSHTGWFVLEVPHGETEIDVRFTAEYRLAPEDSMGMSSAAESVHQKLPLPLPSERRAIRARDTDRARRVFLAHGRDDEFVGRLRELLSLLGLRVMEWEPMVAEAGRGSAPALGDVIHDGLGRAQAIVVLLTPDDMATLHPDLRLPHEDSHELTLRGQPRPNVLMELGAALYAFRRHTIILKVGDIRPMADIGGVNYINFDGGEAARKKLVERLRVAGCEVDDSGTEWTRASRFDGLGAFTRRPRDTGDPQSARR